MSAPAVNTHRRTFRGRGRARDTKASKRNHKNVGTAHCKLVQDSRQQLSSVSPADGRGESRQGASHTKEASYVKGATVHNSHNEPSEARQVLTEQEATHKPYQTCSVTFESSDGCSRRERAKDEYLRLQGRTRNVGQMIQSSQCALQANPETWQQNCLTPVNNIVTSWISIVKFYKLETVAVAGVDFTCHESNPISSEEWNSLSTSIFELVQIAMQSGLLRTAKPGYFKRCGGTIAHMAFDFLDGMPIESMEEFEFGFSDNQRIMLKKWRCNAYNAASMKASGPSRSMAKQQHASQVSQNQRKFEREKKVQRRKEKQCKVNSGTTLTMAESL